MIIEQCGRLLLLKTVTWCGGLKENGPKESSTVRDCGLFGEGMALLKIVWSVWRKCITVGVAFEVFSQVLLDVPVSILLTSFWSRCR